MLPLIFYFPLPITSPDYVLRFTEVSSKAYSLCIPLYFIILMLLYSDLMLLLFKLLFLLHVTCFCSSTMVKDSKQLISHIKAATYIYILMIHLWNSLCASDELVLEVNSILCDELISKVYFLDLQSAISVYILCNTPPNLRYLNIFCRHRA